MLYPVFDESIGVDWDGCDLVERVPGKVNGVPHPYAFPACGRRDSW